MPHDLPGQPHWHEPRADETAGHTRFRRAASPYDRFMETEGVPVFRGIGVRRIEELPLAPWKRLGGRGSYIQLYGTEGQWGMYLAEVPARGALATERHLYEKVVLVAAGRGTTEVWHAQSDKPKTFEWQQGSLFTIPLNARHRFVNATSSPALLLCGTTAPNVLNLFDDRRFVFDCPYDFAVRYSGDADHFQARDGIEPDPVRGLAMRRTNLIPDVTTCELPLDNRRSPGYRRIEPGMAGCRLGVWIGEHQPGRYSSAHRQQPGTVLVCVKGKGCTQSWPAALGTTPWSDGSAGRVLRQDYVPFGLVSTAPLGSACFTQHLNLSGGGLRLMGWHGPVDPNASRPGRPGEQLLDQSAVAISDGGAVIPYHAEDPAVRREFAAMLAREGLASGMPVALYEPEPG